LVERESLAADQRGQHKKSEEKAKGITRILFSVYVPRVCKSKQAYLQKRKWLSKLKFRHLNLSSRRYPPLFLKRREPGGSDFETSEKLSASRKRVRFCSGMSI